MEEVEQRTDEGRQPRSISVGRVFPKKGEHVGLPSTSPPSAFAPPRLTASPPTTSGDDDGSSGWKIFSPTCGRDGCRSSLCGRGQRLCDPCCASAVAPELSTCYCWVLSDSVLRSTSSAGEYGCLQSHTTLTTYGAAVGCLAWEHGFGPECARRRQQRTLTCFFEQIRPHLTSALRDGRSSAVAVPLLLYPRTTTTQLC